MDRDVCAASTGNTGAGAFVNFSIQGKAQAIVMYGYGKEMKV